MSSLPDFYSFSAEDLICSQLGNINSSIGEYWFPSRGINIPQLGANKTYCTKGFEDAGKNISSYRTK